jgi:hypothetical protein
MEVTKEVPVEGHEFSAAGGLLGSATEAPDFASGLPLAASRPEREAESANGRRQAADGDGLRAVFRVARVAQIPSGMDPGVEREWIERRAKLFEAGDFPDKGLRISSEQLEKLARGFNGPVPVLIEHSESPLELGFLTKVEAVDGELFGTVALTKEANELLEAQEAKALSLGLAPDLSEIREVSIVRTPRVADARLFSGVCFCGELCGGEQPGLSDGSGKSDLSDGSDGTADFADTLDGCSHWRRRYEELSAGNRRSEAARTVDGFIREGRICPAQAPFAEAMLLAEDTIEFDGESKPLRQLLIAMIERQPPMALFSAIAPDSPLVSSGAAQGLLPEEAEFYRRHFPDVSLEEIAARRSRQG